MGKVKKPKFKDASTQTGSDDLSKDVTKYFEKEIDRVFEKSRKFNQEFREHLFLHKHIKYIHVIDQTEKIMQDMQDFLGKTIRKSSTKDLIEEVAEIEAIPTNEHQEVIPKPKRKITKTRISKPKRSKKKPITVKRKKVGKCKLNAGKSMEAKNVKKRKVAKTELNAADSMEIKNVKKKKVAKCDLNAENSMQTNNGACTLNNNCNEKSSPAVVTGLPSVPQSRSTITEDEWSELEDNHNNEEWGMDRVVDWLQSNPSDPEPHYRLYGFVDQKVLY